MTNACSIQDPQGAVTLGTPFLRIQGMIGRTAQRAIGLRSKCGTRETMRKRGTCELRWARDDCRRGRSRWLRLVGRRSFGLKGRSKFGRAQVRRGKRLPQFQPDIPCPLRQDLGKLLAERACASTSDLRLALHLHRPAPSQTSHECLVQVKDIRSRKRRGGKGAHKEFVDHPVAEGTNSGVRGCPRMGRDDQTHRRRPSEPKARTRNRRASAACDSLDGWAR